MSPLLPRVVGVVGSTLPFDPFQYCILAASSAIAWAYCLELTLLTLYTFRRWSGLYFYALLVSSWGCTFHGLGFVLKFLTHAPPSAFLPFIEIGWVAMVTGQAFVLFTRLHVVVKKRSTLRLVLAMILVDGICLHAPTIVATIGSNGAHGLKWAPMLNIVERVQLAVFCVQEFVISTIYIVSTVRLLGSIYHSRTRSIMIQLIVINFACLGMDVILIGLEYSNNYVGETSVKAMLYAIKLKIEFAVLNQLISLTKVGLASRSTVSEVHTANASNPYNQRYLQNPGRSGSLSSPGSVKPSPRKLSATGSSTGSPKTSVLKALQWQHWRHELVRSFRTAPLNLFRRCAQDRPSSRKQGKISKTERIEVVSECNDLSKREAIPQPESDAQALQDPHPAVRPLLPPAYQSHYEMEDVAPRAQQTVPSSYRTTLDPWLNQIRASSLSTVASEASSEYSQTPDAEAAADDESDSDKGETPIEQYWPPMCPTPMPLFARRRPSAPPPPPPPLHIHIPSRSGASSRAQSMLLPAKPLPALPCDRDQ